ncbi:PLASMODESMATA CALLOSE-BINDING PROTEIN 3 [Cucurbita argyrosperma subsp. argyrosperma]|uniref:PLASMODESMATA CALLOSE-BINDING PROTEIN 3-like isoform X2 n=1 Tax=Cucurbita moschata TaxID=3662 RepID=A0A6J1GT57_CUCMO|nr:PLASMODESMATA CALLOSE-BINDING PROTEIN 3-like isoform X2 [Cucurbita moschata]KAG7012093.1 PLASMODESMATA CALLOSE-BINDING PROTEIN 3 [Cucurbita argyrosperma subsp. argyrosperma]
MPPTLALSVLLLAAMAGHSSGTWCVCKDGVGDTTLQKALDYACGAGADCNPIRQNAACFLPNTVRAHCSYAVNSYFQKKGQTQGSCDFGGVATISTTDPSASGCSYPSTAGGGGGSTPVTMTPTPPGTTTVPGMTSPVARSPPTTTTTNPLPNTASPTGVLGGAGTGVSPTGAGTTTTDESDGGFRLQRHIFFSFSTVFLFSFMVWWD